MNVGLIGIGTVGGGTYKVLTENFQEIFNKIGIEIKVTHVADKDIGLAEKIVDKSVQITSDAFELIANKDVDLVVELIGGTFGVMKETHDLAIKVGRPTARQIDNKKNKYMASDCPLAGKHINQLSKDTEIRHDEALHPIEIMAKAYKL